MADSNKKVLVVEDDGMLAQMIANQVSKKYSTVTVHDGEEAMQKIKSEKPDLMVLDLLLPKLDGFGVIRQMRTLPDPVLSKIPVIVISNLRDEESVKKMQQFGIEDFFIKSDISVGILLNRINRVFTQGAMFNKMQAV